MSRLVRGFGSITLLLLAFGARADSVANWADTTTEIVARVPRRATSGPISVTTPVGTATSATSLKIRRKHR